MIGTGELVDTLHGMLGFSLLSFVSNSLLWGFIDYKIVTYRGWAWREHRRTKKGEQDRRQGSQIGEALRAEAPYLMSRWAW